MEIILFRHFQNDRNAKKLQRVGICVNFQPSEAFHLFSTTCFRPSTKKLSTRVFARQRARTAQIDPGRDGELARRVSHDVAILLNRGTERRGSDEERIAIEFKSRASTDEAGSSRRRAHTTGEREAAEAQGNTLAHSSRSSAEPVQGSVMCAREGRQLSDSERTAFAGMRLRSVAGKPSVADVCREWGIGTSQGYRIYIAIERSTMSTLDLEVGARAC